jgi:hypothetical protein
MMTCLTPSPTAASGNQVLDWRRRPLCPSSCYVADAEARLSACEAEEALYEHVWDAAAILYFERVMDRAACEEISADEIERVLIKLNLRDPIPDDASGPTPSEIRV